VIRQRQNRYKVDSYLATTTVYESLQSSVTYTPASGAGNNIVFTFDRPYYCGQYVNGDWWVRPDSPGGTVTITGMTPAYSTTSGTPSTNSTDATSLHGYEINPRGSNGHGFDGRITATAFNSNYIPPLPLVLKPSYSGTLSVVKARSIVTVTDVTPLQFVAVLTVVDAGPLDNIHRFRPSYRGNWNKTSLNISAISLGALPHYTSAGLDALKASVTFAQIKAQMQGVRLDHAGGAPSRYFHAADNFAPTGGMGGASYQAVIANLNDSALMRMMFDDFSYSDATCKSALINYLQAAIDAVGPTYALPAFANVSQTITVDYTTSIVTWGGGTPIAHGLDECCVVWFNNATPANIPGGITNTVSGTSAVLYYVVNPTPTTYQISLTKYGTPVTITNNGSGTNTCSTVWLPHSSGSPTQTYNPGDILSYATVTYICNKTAANRFNNPTLDPTYFETQCLWGADGGHGAGRKPLLVAAAALMPSQASFFTNAIAAEEATVMFGDDGHTFQTTGGGTVLWGRTPGTGITGENAYWSLVLTDAGGAKDFGDFYAQIDGGSPVYPDQTLTMVCTNGSNSITIAQTAGQYAATPINVGAKIYTAASIFATNPAYVKTISNDGATTTITTSLSDDTTANNVTAATASYACTFYSAHLRGSVNIIEVGIDGYQSISSAPIKYNSVAMRMLFGTAQSSAPSAQWGNSRPFSYANRYVSSGVLASPDTKPPYTNEILAPYGSGFLPNSTTGSSGRVPRMNGVLVDYYGGYNNTFNNACWTDWAANHP
jgi:hypothetical protein